MCKKCAKTCKNVHLKYRLAKNLVKTCKNVQNRAKTCKNVHLKYFLTQFRNVHLRGPCSLRPCISRPCCKSQIVGYENFRKTVYLLYSTYAAVDLDEKLHRRPWPWPVLNLAQGGQEGCRAALGWAARAALAKNRIQWNLLLHWNSAIRWHNLNSTWWLSANW